MTITELVEAVGECNKAHGIYDYDFRPAEYLMQIVSEAGEVYEELRKGRQVDDTGPAQELADIVLSCCGYAAYFNIDLEEALMEKFEYDKGRRPKHDKRF